MGPMNHFVVIKLQLASMDHNLHVKGKRGKGEKGQSGKGHFARFVSFGLYIRLEI